MCKQIKLRTSYDTEEPETFYSNGEGEGCGVGGGGEEGNSRLRTLQSRIPPPLFLTSPPLPFFSITKYCPLLRNFPHFSLFSCRSLLSQLPYSSPPPPPKKKHTHTHTHLPFLALFPLPGFLTLKAFAIAKYWALFCCVISPIPLASHPLRITSSHPSLSHLSLHFSPGLPQPFSSPL